MLWVVIHLQAAGREWRRIKSVRLHFSKSFQWGRLSMTSPRSPPFTNAQDFVFKPTMNSVQDQAVTGLLVKVEKSDSVP